MYCVMCVFVRVRLCVELWNGKVHVCVIGVCMDYYNGLVTHDNNKGIGSFAPLVV